MNVEAIKSEGTPCDKCVFNGEACGENINSIIKALELPNCDNGYYYIKKPLKSIRVTSEIMDKIARSDWRMASEHFYNNEPVEIINQSPIEQEGK